MGDNDDLYMETFVDNNIDTRISYPNHICVFGSTQSGKSSLIGEILDNVDKVYSLDENKFLFGGKKIIIISPIEELEIGNFMKSKSEWEITLFNNMNLDNDFETQIKNSFKVSSNYINILLLDDFLIQASMTQMNIINQIFSYYRHMNVSVIATIHSYNKRFGTILEQSAIILTLYGFNQITILRNVLKYHIYKGTAKIIRKIRKLYLDKMKAHQYICLNFSKKAISSDQYFITDNVFSPSHGITLHQIISILMYLNIFHNLIPSCAGFNPFLVIERKTKQSYNFMLHYILE